MIIKARWNYWECLWYSVKWKIRQNYTAFENYVYLLVDSRGNALHHLINNMCVFSVGIRQMV